MKGANKDLKIYTERSTCIIVFFCFHVLCINQATKCFHWFVPQSQSQLSSFVHGQAQNMNTCKYTKNKLCRRAP